MRNAVYNKRRMLRMGLPGRRRAERRFMDVAKEDVHMVGVTEDAIHRAPP